MSKNYKSLIQKILSLNRDYETNFMDKKNLLMGFYGELLVLDQLKSKKIDFEYRGGQSRYDIKIKKGNKEIKLEIRTSPLKTERFFSKGIENWGWKVQVRDKNGNLKPVNYDWIILIKLSDNWGKNQFFAFPKSEIENMGEFKWKGYKIVGKAVYMFLNKDMLKKALKEKNAFLINNFSKKFDKNPNKYKLSWNKILK